MTAAELRTERGAEPRVGRHLAKSWNGLFYFFYRRTRCREDAEDLVGETMLRVLGSDTSRVRNWDAWLMQVANNLLRDRARYRRLRPVSANLDLELLDRILEQRPGGLRPEEALLARELEKIVDRVLARCSEPHRQVFQLRIQEGCELSAIARELGMPLGSVKTALRITLRKIKAEMERAAN